MQHVKIYILLKYVIKKENIKLIIDMFIKAVVLFHEINKYNY